MIEVDRLTKRYGPVPAIQDVSFTVEKGQIVGFLGPNGAGKTTTMRILSCFMPASGGTARVAGYDVFEQPIEAKRRTGYLPETPPLYPDMTVRDYLSFVARIKGVPRGERTARINEMMEKTRIADVADRHCGKLSKGYRQRVGLAQALMHNPDVLILDEPTAGLDPKQIIETRQLIKALAAYPQDLRVAIVGTGSFSLEVFGPRIDPGKTDGVPDPQWGHEICTYLQSGDTETLIAKATEERMYAAGNVGGELLNWIAMLAFIDNRKPDFLIKQMEQGHAYAGWRWD